MPSSADDRDVVGLSRGTDRIGHSERHQIVDCEEAVETGMAFEDLLGGDLGLRAFVVGIDPLDHSQTRSSDASLESAQAERGEDAADPPADESYVADALQ